MSKHGHKKTSITSLLTTAATMQATSPVIAPVDVRSWRPATTSRGRARAGIEARSTASLESHAVWNVSADRHGIIELLEEQSARRVQDLIPLRYKRMSESAFTFYRGTALIMANDLASTPVTGIPVQCVGDAHIGNFGMFLSPTRHLVFDINDFDETTTGPWEWDIKRLATSVEICGRTNGFDEGECRDAVMRCAHTYRESMDQFSQMDYLDVWYDHLDVSATLDRFEGMDKARSNRVLREAMMRASVKDSVRAASKLTTVENGAVRFRSDPPELVPLEELAGDGDLTALRASIDALLESYRRSLYEDRRHVFDHYRYQDTAHKVVGVGSVGTRAWVSVLTGRDINDPLMLQMKEADESVLERFVGASPYATHGERVVQGQKLIQTTSDVLLGWAKFTTEDGRPCDYYVRQLWDGKGSINLKRLGASELSDLGRMCAWSLAHAHARTGDSMAIANYMGGSDEFDVALAEFAHAYADQNEADYDCFMHAYTSGKWC